MDVETFSRKVKVTMYARFEGHRRLEAKSNISVLLFIIFSLIVVAGSLILLVYGNDLQEKIQKFVAVALIIFSINSLAFQLYEFSQRYEVRSNNMKLSGMKLAELRNKLDIEAKEITPEIRQEYENILKTHFENHAPVDHRNALIWVDDLDKFKNSFPITNKYFQRYSTLLYFITVNSVLIYVGWRLIQKL